MQFAANASESGTGFDLDKGLGIPPGPAPRVPGAAESLLDSDDSGEARP
jgi:hypothetical protein